MPLRMMCSKLVPPPRRHRLRYFGVLAPNAPLRAAVTAMAPEGVADSVPQPASKTPELEESTPNGRCQARYLWAVLLARIYEVFPLTCPHCAGEMRIIAFVPRNIPDRKGGESRQYSRAVYCHDSTPFVSSA